MSYRKELIEKLVPAVRLAGDEIMRIYHRNPDAEIKLDGSPVTEADQKAETILLAALRQHAPDITIISEENANSHAIDAPDRFFLVDPLDGTKEFLKRDGKGSFTVNIGLVENRVPVLGIVYAPALEKMFTGSTGDGAFLNERPIHARKPHNGERTAVASASHRDEMTNQWLAENNISRTVSIGSSLKFCLVASGEADIYPRFGPTMEWDTAAGQAVLLAAGGHVTTPEKTPFLYGKDEYRNGPFIASA